MKKINDGNKNSDDDSKSDDDSIVTHLCLVTISYLSMSHLSVPLTIIIPTVKTSELTSTVEKAQLIVSLIEAKPTASMPMS